MSDELPIKIYRQNRNTMMMRATLGAIEVFIPHKLKPTDKRVKDFIAQHLPKLAPQTPQTPPEKVSQAEILRLVKAYSQQMNVTPTRVSLRDMRRKWGSCSSLGSVTLNTRLSWLEPILVEYIVCHELAHLIELNHSPAFWAIVERYMPDYKALIQQLREAEKALWKRD